jgi:UDPglucose--hexose-1-phosphate uridylyltransferase
MLVVPRQPEYRKDPLSDGWVVIAAERNGRPDEFRDLPSQRSAGPCPFCHGNEPATPGEICKYPPNSGEQWKVRVVPNKFPAVVRCDGLSSAVVNKTFKNGSPRLFTSVLGHGGHEVIIESPQHAISLTDLDDESLRLTFLAYRDRMRSLASEGPWNYVQIFKNAGAAAGSSIEHAHSQVVGLPAVPVRVADELTHSRDFLTATRRRLFETMLEEELAQGTRIVAETVDFVALCPYASRFAYETWILPRQTLPRFETSSEALAVALGRFTATVIGKLERKLNRPAYNYLLHSAPFDGTADDHYHWHMEIFPRVTKPAGFEWGTGYYINPVAPEQAAEVLRSA